MSSKFRMAVTCPVCDETILSDGWTVDFTQPEGVVTLDMFACEEFECERCGTIVYTGDVEQMYEYEEHEIEGQDEDEEEYEED